MIEKYEARIKGDFDKVLSKLEKEILNLYNNKKIVLTEKKDFKTKNNHCSIRTYDYLPMIGGGATLFITLYQSENNYNELFVIASGPWSFLPIKDGYIKLIEDIQDLLQEKFK